MILRSSPDGDNPHGRFAEYTSPGLEIQKKTLRAREKGAAGVIFVSGEQDFKEDRLSRLRHDLNFLDAGVPAVIVSRRVAQSLLSSAGTTLAEAEKRSATSAAPLALDGATVEFKTDVIKINGKGVNVAGILEGSDPRLASQYVVIGAHYDHLGLGGPESLAQRPEGDIHYGADDNASGTSALIELARALSAERSKLRRSILFLAFSGEELGLLGSAAYTKNPIVPLKSTVAMLNMDMVGRLRNGSLFVGGVGTSPSWKPLLEKLNTSIEAPASSQGGGAASRFKLSFGQDGFGPSDHQSFYVRDIPVLFFFTGTHEDYHRPSDTAEKINTEGISQVAQLVREVAMFVANEDSAVAFNRVQVETRPAGRGFRVYLGTVPNYSDQNDGLKLDGVRPGSPAERAGLRAGDVVTKLAHVPIKNVYDYTYALGELRPGEEIEIVIKRDGREMQLKLTPDKRQ
jgi:Zn-dependent M28 family amino/carboxypeptidase